MSSTSWLEEGLEALQVTAGHRDRLVVQGGNLRSGAVSGHARAALHSRQHLQDLVCMPIALHVLCVLTCVRRSAGTRRTVNTVSRLSGACCLLCLCDAYCCGCCDASSGDAYACSSADADCNVAPAGRAASPDTSATRGSRQQKRWGKHVYCVYMCSICMHLYACSSTDGDRDADDQKGRAAKPDRSTATESKEDNEVSIPVCGGMHLDA